jgi:hypothetical protein
MLFDLRSRGRRRTVQAIYAGLALVMLGGLLLVGVGTGSGGGILNAFTNNGSGNQQSSVVSQQEKDALKATKQNPSSPAAWSQLVQAQWIAANQGNNFSSTSGFTTAGQTKLKSLLQSWQRYQALVKKPDSTVALFAARANAALGNYSGEASTWETIAAANPKEIKAFFCLAASSYAAKQTRKGDLAAAKVITLVPKVQRLTFNQELAAAKTSPATAQSC